MDHLWILSSAVCLDQRTGTWSLSSGSKAATTASPEAQQPKGLGTTGHEPTRIRSERLLVMNIHEPIEHEVNQNWINGLLRVVGAWLSPPLAEMASRKTSQRRPWHRMAQANGEMVQPKNWIIEKCNSFTYLI